MDALVSTEWLAADQGRRDLRIVDATWFLPNSGLDARQEFEAEHIPGAVFMDLDDLVDEAHPAPHMLPPLAKFVSRVRALGLGERDRIVIYDNSPLHSAARAWWMLRHFGARDVAVLDGGLAKWKAEGHPVERGASAAPKRSHFTAERGEGEAASLDFVSGIVFSGAHELVDARSPSRFAGEEPEPRPGVEPGHIPGSLNLHYARLFNADGTFKPRAAIRAEFQAAGVDLDKPMVTTCGSGITAAVLVLAAHLVGKDDVMLYDGSWAEWGADPATAKSVGPA